GKLHLLAVVLVLKSRKRLRRWRLLNAGVSARDVDGRARHAFGGIVLVVGFAGLNFRVADRKGVLHGDADCFIHAEGRVLVENQGQRESQKCVQSSSSFVSVALFKLSEKSSKNPRTSSNLAIMRPSQIGWRMISSF